MKKLLIILSTTIVLLSSCYYDKEEDIFPSTGNCDVSAVTYANTVLPLLQNSGCLGCHSGSAPSGNISLSGYNNVKVVAQNGKLFGVINHSPGFSPMPQGGSKMSSCSINRIKAWIDAGAVNN